MANLENKINESRFKHPSLDDFYDEMLIETVLETIDTTNPKSAAYYVEEPFTTKLGYYPEYSAFVIKATPVLKYTDKQMGDRKGEKAEALNFVDGDTLAFYTDTVQDGGSFIIDEVEYKNFKDYWRSRTKQVTFESNEFKIRSVGIDAPEVPHLGIVGVLSKDMEKSIKTVKTVDFEKNDNLVYNINTVRDKEEYEFIFIKGEWHEVIVNHGTNICPYPFDNENEQKLAEEVKKDANGNYYTYLSYNDQTKNDVDKDGVDLAIKAKNMLIDLLATSEDMRIVIDHKQTYKATEYSKIHSILKGMDNNEHTYWEIAKAAWQISFSDTYQHIHFPSFGEDAYGRLLAAVYVKKDGTWINCNKYLLAKMDGAIELKGGLTPIEKYTGTLSDAFKVWTYDNSNTSIVDGFYNISKADYDDRNEIQKELTGLDLSQYKDFTVMIGDCLFMVPPTSIRIVNQFESNRIPLLRSKATMVKQNPQSNRILELTLYFNGDYGINGYPITRKLPKQTNTENSETYYMNGLRSLIALFKFTPFLPIENNYINGMLGIEAVSLANLQINTMPMYPNSMAVTLTLQEFNYRAYLNELPVPDLEAGDDIDRNMFAATINYQVMRYYYQRCIQNGNLLANMDSKDIKFIEETLGNKTCLIPMKFENPSINFMVLDEQWLDKKLAVKLMAAKKPLRQTTELKEKEVEWIKQVGIAFIKIMEIGKTYKYTGDETYAKIRSEMINGSVRYPYLNRTEYKDVEKKEGIVTFIFDTTSLTSEELRNLSILISKTLDLKDQSIFKDGKISLTMTTDGWAKDDAYKFAEFCAYRSTDYGDEISNEWDKFAQNTNQAFYEKIKEQAIDLETVYSAKFKEYPLDDIIVQNFSVTMSNMLPDISLKAQHGKTSQYAGGQDTVLEFMFHTTNETTITNLNLMQDKAADQLLTYRQVINCYPIRIQSELTRLCGIYETLIESIDISTVPNQPGLYAVSIRAISVDRTTRNRETLQRLDSINNATSLTPATTPTTVYKTYFDLNRTLSQAELYPDLELPTIEEMEDYTGFKFIKYSRNRKNRIYPDPDFYFVYGYVYSAQIFRNIITEYFKKNDRGIIALAESVTEYYNKNSATGHIAKAETQEGNLNEVINFTSMNSDYSEKYSASIRACESKIEQLRTSINEQDKKKYEVYQKTRALYDTAVQTENALIAILPTIWNISENIKCPLGEDVSQYNDEEDDVTKEMKKVTDKIVEIIDDVLKEPINSDTHVGDALKHSSHENLVMGLERVRSDNEALLDVWHDIMQNLGNDVKKVDTKSITALYEAAAMALSGNSEYSSDLKKENYQSNAYYIHTLTKEEQKQEKEDIKNHKIPNTPEVWCPNSKLSNNSNAIAKTSKDAIENGYTFSAFQIKKYDKDFLKEFYDEDEITNNEADFIDPYYNKSLNPDITDEKREEYMNLLMKSSTYSVVAFHRIVLVWVKKLIKNKVFLNYFDINREEMKQTLTDFANSSQRTELVFDGELSQQQIAAVLMSSPDAYVNDIYKPSEEVEILSNNFENYAREVIGLLEGYEENMIIGKIFMAVVCATLEGNDYILGDLFNRNIASLTSKTMACQKPQSTLVDMDDGERKYRKFIRGLCVTKKKLISGLELIASGSNGKYEEAMISRDQKLWDSASEDPSLWILHSFYDMVTSDKRGRMARAFPTYYLLLIDEGRKIGYWKLHDNFYNMSAISEFEVVKSRKIPADTARIVMTNMFKTFSTEDEDVKTDYSTNLKDAWKSIFSPSAYFSKEEERRLRQLDINRATMKPGVRLHLRMGYSSDASELPILFNGVVTSADTGDVCEIIAQSDGHELSNPYAFATAYGADAEDLKNEPSFFRWVQNFFTDGDTPKNLIKNIFTTKSGITGSIINKISSGRFFNDNMFGITHFGELDMKTLHNDGEIMQNIYEIEGGMPWSTQYGLATLSENYRFERTPKFSIELKDKSVWDVLNICASTGLEFITGIAPFGLRSTVFMGKPHYYYAYDYDITDDDVIIEKRKPFQQYHIIDSFSDIIGNNIKANGSDLKTVAIATYKGPNWRGKIIERKNIPLYADFDIYPEFQKNVVVDTGITFKGNKAGLLFFNKYSDKWGDEGGQKLAWRVAAKALKDSFKDMYEGEVIIIGDPSIKPYDKVFLYDIYENMDGVFEVEATVQRLSPDSGYTTSVYADCVTAVDSRYEQLSRMWGLQIASGVIGLKSAFYVAANSFMTTKRPAVKLMSKIAMSGGKNAANMINKLSGFLGKEQIIDIAASQKWGSQFLSTVGLTSQEMSLWNSFNKIETWKNMGLAFDSFKSEADLLANLKAISANLSEANPLHIANTLEEALNAGKVASADKDDIAKIIKELKGVNYSNTELFTYTNNLKTTSLKQLESIADKSDEIKEAIKILKNTDVKDYSSFSKVVSNLNDVSKHVNLDLKKEATTLKSIFSNIDKAVVAGDKIVEGSKAMKLVFKGVSTAKIAANIVLAIAEMAFEYVMVKNTYNWIENVMASFNVLTVYPLKKNGSVMVAGIDGHKGLVYGSPSWNSVGPIEKTLNYICNKKDGFMGELLQNFVLSDEMKRIADTYKQREAVGEYAADKEYYIDPLLQTMAESQASKYSKYRAMVFARRISKNEPDKANESYVQQKVMVTDIYEGTLTTNSIIVNQLIPITNQNEILHKYFEAETFMLIHDAEASEDKYERKTYEFPNIQAIQSKCTVSGMIYEDKKRVDLPFLHKDAFQVLNRILEEVEIKATEKKYGDNEKIKTYFKSGLVVNDTSWASTGYIFRIEVLILTTKEVREILAKVSDELQDIFIQEGADEGSNLLMYRELSNNTFEICITPRDVTETEYNQY